MLVRPIRPDDAAGLLAFPQDLSTRSRYLRFFNVHPELRSARSSASPASTISLASRS